MSVSPVFAVLAVTMGILLLWGLLSPRSQWRALAGWSVSDPHAIEPGTVSYLIRQILFFVGLAGMAIVGASLYVSYLNSLPTPPTPPTPIEQMWGKPDPDIVNRVVVPLSGPPGGLVDQPVLGYQEFDLEEGAPDYLRQLDIFERLGNPQIPGILGQDPPEGFSAVDIADLLIHVRGDLLCIPRAAVIRETETAVEIAVYYGLPNSPDGSGPDHLGSCSAQPPVSISLLIPIDLQAPLGSRDVQTLDGSRIQRIPIFR